MSGDEGRSALTSATYAIYGSHMKLAKTTVYVAEGDYRRLKAIAQAQKRPTAELVRDAIAEYARRHGPRGTPRSVGVARSGRGDLSERSEELLAGMGRRG